MQCPEVDLLVFKDLNDIPKIENDHGGFESQTLKSDYSTTHFYDDLIYDGPKSTFL